MSRMAVKRSFSSYKRTSLGSLVLTRFIWWRVAAIGAFLKVGLGLGPKAGRTSGWNPRAVLRSLCMLKGREMLCRRRATDGRRFASTSRMETERSMVLTRRFSTWCRMMLAWPSSFANLWILVTIRPRMIIPPTVNGKTSPLEMSFVG